MSLAPIALFVYNRPWHTRQTIFALQQNELAAQSDLIIFSDGPKNEQAKPSVEAVRQFLPTIDGFKSVSIVEKEKNCGLSRSIISGVTDVLDQYGKIIVLEDDLVTSPYFLRFMNDALTEYEQEEKVISIHGYIYPVADDLPDTFFIKGADCWGWATWKRGWDLFEQNGQKLLEELQLRNLAKAFNMGNAYPYDRMLAEQVVGKNDSWAIRWYASAFLKNRLTLYPGKSLVHNIGNDNSGTHSESTPLYDTTLAQKPISVNSSAETKESAEALMSISNYLKYSSAPPFKQLIYRLSRSFNEKSR